MAVQILDWAHAVGHGVACARVIFADDAQMIALWKRRVETLLVQGQIERLLDELTDCRAGVRSLAKRKAIHDPLRYYRTHRHQMSYPEHRDPRSVGESEPDPPPLNSPHRAASHR